MPGWALAQGAGLTDPAAIARRFAFLAKRHLAGLLGQRRVRLRQRSCCCPTAPCSPTSSGAAIDQVLAIVDDLEDRFAVCLYYFLKDDTLGYRQNEVMVDLLAVVRQLMEPDSHMDVEGS